MADELETLRTLVENQKQLIEQLQNDLEVERGKAPVGAISVFHHAQDDDLPGDHVRYMATVSPSALAKTPGLSEHIGRAIAHELAQLAAKAGGDSA